MHDHDIFQESFDRNRTFPLYVSNRLNLESEYISSMPNAHLHYSHNGFKNISEVAFTFSYQTLKLLVCPHIIVRTHAEDCVRSSSATLMGKCEYAKLLLILKIHIHRRIFDKF